VSFFGSISQAILFGTSVCMLVACGGEQDTLTKVALADDAVEAVAITADTAHQALDAQVQMRSGQSLDVSIVNTESDQVIRVMDGLEVLFSQRMSHDGRLQEIQTVDVTFSTSLNNSISIADGHSSHQYFRDCYARRILCHLDAQEALAGIQIAQPDAFFHVNGENALTGLNALHKTADSFKWPTIPILPEITPSFPVIDAQ
jgi:hypothetical protein